MSFTDVFPLAGIGKVDQSFSQLDLNAKSQLLRDKIKLLRQSSKAPQEALHQIGQPPKRNRARAESDSTVEPL